MVMIKAVVFDMFETLVTHYNCPLYFGEQIAKDIGISNEEFQAIWKPANEKRTIGLLTLEDLLEEILRKHNCYSKDLLDKIVAKRVATKQLCFEKLHPQIVPMLEKLKQSNRKIALISNCYSEEVYVIRRSVLSQYFDKIYLSYEQGMQKPNLELFKKCVRELNVTPEECLYVGDGGSDELMAAKQIGMNAVQAGWYISKSGLLKQQRQEQFQLLLHPREIFLHLQ